MEVTSTSSEGGVEEGKAEKAEMGPKDSLTATASYNYFDLSDLGSLSFYFIYNFCLRSGFSGKKKLAKHHLQNRPKQASPL